MPIGCDHFDSRAIALATRRSHEATTLPHAGRNARAHPSVLGGERLSAHRSRAGRRGRRLPLRHAAAPRRPRGERPHQARRRRRAQHPPPVTPPAPECRGSAGGTAAFALECPRPHPARSSATTAESGCSPRGSSSTSPRTTPTSSRSAGRLYPAAEGTQLRRDLQRPRRDLVNLFRAARDRGEERLQTLALTPFAREEFDASYGETTDPLERARRMVVQFPGLRQRGSQR